MSSTYEIHSGSSRLSSAAECCAHLIKDAQALVSVVQASVCAGKTGGKHGLCQWRHAAVADGRRRLRQRQGRLKVSSIGFLEAQIGQGAGGERWLFCLVPNIDRSREIAAGSCMAVTIKRDPSGHLTQLPKGSQAIHRLPLDIGAKALHIPRQR